MLHIDTSQLKLQKVFTEVRFKDAFSLPNKKYEILEELQNNYPTYNSDSPEKVTLLDTKKKIQIHVELNRIIVDWDEPTEFREFSRLSNSAINKIAKILNINYFARVGVRSLYSIDVNSPEEASGYIFNRYLSNNAKDTSDLADTINNPAVRFSGRKGSVFFNFAINYQNKQFITNDLVKMKAEITNAHSILFDIDTYRNEINRNRVNNMFDNSEDFIYSVINYIKKVEG